MLAHLSIWALVAAFALSGAVIWWAGIVLAATADRIDAHFGWGQGMGGAILLAVTTNLPEVAIVTGAAYTHSMDLAVGNILGGIAIQTAVLVLLDGPGLRHKIPLMSTVRSLTIVVQGMVLVAILMCCVIGTLLPKTMIVARVTPVEIAILAIWIAGLWLTALNEDRDAWRASRDHIADLTPAAPHQRAMLAVFGFFALAAVATLACGVVLEIASNELAARMGWGGAVFGATILSAVTALPEVTTGLAAVRAGNFELAISDIIGGNAFLPVLLILGSILSGSSLLPGAPPSYIYLTALGALLTAVYCTGAVIRSRRMVLGAGIDSIVVLVLYAIGVIGLFAIPS